MADGSACCGSAPCLCCMKEARAHRKFNTKNHDFPRVKQHDFSRSQHEEIQSTFLPVFLLCYALIITVFNVPQLKL